MLYVLFALLTAVFWSLHAVLGRKALQRRSDPLTGVLVDRLSGLLAATLFFLSTLPKTVFSDGGWLYVAVGGLIGNGFAVLFFYYALNSIGASRTTVITSSRPLFAAAISIVLLNERITATLIAGTVFIVVGAASATSGSTRQNTSKGANRMGGSLWALLASVCWGAFPVLIKLGGAQMEIPSQIFDAMLGGTLGYTAFLAIAGKMSYAAVKNLGRNTLALFSIAGVVNIAALYVFFTALSLSPVVYVMPIVGTFPFFTMLFARMLLKEAATVRLLAGSILIFIGMMLVVSQ